MAIEYAAFDLYHILVEIIFGNFAIAVAVVAGVYGVICGMFRMPLLLILTIVGTFALAMLVGFFGSLAGIILSALAFSYLAFAVIKWFQGGQP